MNVFGFIRDLTGSSAKDEKDLDHDEPDDGFEKRRSRSVGGTSTKANIRRRLAKTVWGESRSKPQGSSEMDADEEVPDVQPQNPLNELQILTGHNDIVRVMYKIDDFKVATAGDDGTIIVWNVAAGKQLCQLQGHTRQVSCLLMLDQHTLVSGSADKTIRVWNLDTGTCEQVLNNAHSASIKCLAKLESEEGPPMFCSGGNDNQLCIWKSTPQQTQLLGCIERQEDENLYCLLPISGKRLVTASHSSYLFVYNTDTLKFDKLLAYHRESVQCLFNITDKLFVSGSLDGSIVLWQSETLTPLRVLEFPEKYFENHSYICPVNHFALLSARYLCAAIGRGFRVYDVAHGDCVIESKEAHDAPVLRLVSLYKGLRLASCSADSSIKIWEIPTRPKGTGASSSRRRSQKQQPAQPRPLGDMLGHSGAVHDLIALNENSVASCGADHLVILWKDGKVQSELRNQAASAWIVHQSLQESEKSTTKEESKRSSFNDLRHLLLARRHFMQETLDLSEQAEQEEDEDNIAQREMTWPYSFSDKRPHIPLEVDSRPVVPPGKWTADVQPFGRSSLTDQNGLTTPGEIRVGRARSKTFTDEVADAPLASSFPLQIDEPALEASRAGGGGDGPTRSSTGDAGGAGPGLLAERLPSMHAAILLP